ncbi:hypothetical protein Salat_2976200 [Sesamum alatum]|uniref:Uncharacterized protein n=1 Tax=Sesamum alatum TaxID=300844 RepID=A0AAE1XIJ2_9LAMI|nr:hypothetical protein Salat_2976200 [Sesamum alatum]
MAQPHQQPAFPTRKELKMKEESIESKSLPTHKGGDSSESSNGGGEKILIESSTVLNSEKDFSKCDQIDRESHHLLEKKPRKEEESLRQELGKQEGEARKGEARGSPSLGRLCPGSGNLSLASSGRLVLACALLQGLRFITPKAFSELLKLSREYQMLTVTKRLSVDAEPTSSVEQHNEYKSVRENLAAYLLYPRVLARLGSFFEPCFSLPPIPVPTVQNRPMEYSQVVRHRFLVPACKGSNPFTPDYEHPIGSVKNELTTTGEAADCSP